MNDALAVRRGEIRGVTVATSWAEPGMNAADLRAVEHGVRAVLVL